VACMDVLAIFSPDKIEAEDHTVSRNPANCQCPNSWKRDVAWATGMITKKNFHLSLM
jgi:hypothetical protein